MTNNDLDSLDELLDDDYSDDSNDSSQEVIVDYQMTRSEAEEITDAIKSSTKAIYVLLAQAHANKAHKALGYLTWADYVKDQFEMSPQHSYHLLDLNKVTTMIEEAVPEGTIVRLTEAQARDIKRELPRITEQIAEATEGLAPDEARAVLDQIVEEEREQKRIEEKAAKQKEKEKEEAEKEGYQRGLEAAADALLEQDKAFSADAPEVLTDRADSELIEVEVSGSVSAMNSEDAVNLYNFFNVIKTVPGLPDPSEIIDLIQDQEQSDVVEENILEVTEWLNRFQSLWEAKNWD